MLTEWQANIDEVQATLTRPYTILPINEHEAWLIHWRGVKMPIFWRFVDEDDLSKIIEGLKKAVEITKR